MHLFERFKNLNIDDSLISLEYVILLPKNFDYNKIQYSDEYYDVLGMKRQISI